jgi:hypothetical protein
MAICPQRQIDRRVWVGTRNKEFMVKSAYHMAKEIQEEVHGGFSNIAVGNLQWKMVWKLEVLRMVKNFLWQAGNDILLTRVNLLKRGIIEDPMCPICILERETTSHIIWSCVSARDVWSEGYTKLHKC